MKAMIFAAGLGSRLKPLTDKKPKALIEIAGKPMLYWVVEKLINHGFDRIVINIHHHAGILKEAIKNLPFNVEIIISNEENCLLDTGGGLLKAKPWLDGDKPFLVHNVDIISNINLKELYSYHLGHGGIATLATTKRESDRCFLWDKNKLAGWENTSTGEKILVRDAKGTPQKKAFSGIHVINPEIFKYIKDTGKFSLNKVYLDLANEKDIFSWEHDHKYWFDLGTVEKIKKAENSIKQNPEIFLSDK